MTYDNAATNEGQLFIKNSGTHLIPCAIKKSTPLERGVDFDMADPLGFCALLPTRGLRVGHPPRL
jgi:hypothetical protein